MGAACCVAARDKTIPADSNGDHRNRNSRYSPTWSFRGENRRRVAGEDASVRWLSHGINSCHSGMDSKLEMTYTSEDGGSLDGFQRRMWPMSPLSDRTVGHARNSESGRSISRAMSTDTASQQVESRELSAYVIPSPEKLSVSSVPSTSSSLTPSSKAHSQHASSTPSRRSNHSQRFLQMVPSNMTPAVKSLRSPSASVERPPTPSWSNELNRGSFWGISDDWSVNAFTELVASSHGGEGSSLDGEAMDLSPDKMGKTGGRMSASTSGGLQACSVCFKSLTERSSWSAQEIIANSELPVVAVLICGHVYHADCLEVMTSEIDKYDPACPICTLGERKTVEMSEKALIVEMETSVKRDRRSKNQVVITDASMDLARLQIGGSDGKDNTKDSSSASRSTSARPFFRRHFSFGSRGSRTLMEVHSSKRRGLVWTKSCKERPPTATFKELIYLPTGSIQQ